MSGINPANATLVRIFIISSPVISFMDRQGHPHFVYKIADT